MAPLMIGLIVVAEPLFLFLLTEKWANSIPYFQLLCVVGLFFPIVVQNYNLLRIKGRTDLHLKLEIAKYTLTAIAIALTYKSGIIALLYGQICVAILSHVLVSHFAGKLIKYSLLDQLRELFPIVTTALVMGFVMFFAGKVNIESNFLLFTFQSIVGILVYIGMNTLLKSAELIEYKSIAGNFYKTILAKVKSSPWKRR
jgi:O-antigen/teichoic acid export membrane protein